MCGKKEEIKSNPQHVTVSLGFFGQKCQLTAFDEAAENVATDMMETVEAQRCVRDIQSE